MDAVGWFDLNNLIHFVVRLVEYVLNVSVVCAVVWGFEQSMCGEFSTSLNI